jgi:TnpA family transposase
MARNGSSAMLKTARQNFTIRIQGSIKQIVTIKLKKTTASDLFRRLNSYSKQHGLYQALKAFGQILKNHFNLRVTTSRRCDRSV